MKITFCGAAGTVTGSSYLLTTDHSSPLLIDMGMFQGKPEVEALNHKPLLFDPKDIPFVLLTHAHLDHCGRLPMLARFGFTGEIFMTEATQALLELSLFDSAKVMAEHDHGQPTLYSEQDVEKLLSHVRIVSYDKPFALDGYKIVYRDAGHILGSASIEVAVDGKTYAFSGDLGNSPQELIRPTEYIKKADIVIMESTYGARLHNADDAVSIFAEEINTIENLGSTLLIPAFSLERSQEILHYIDHLKADKRISQEIPVYLDSPMAQKATEIFKDFPELYSRELAAHIQSDDPFNFPGLVTVSSHTASAKLREDTTAKVIIAGSGMMTGGRITAHAQAFLPDPNTRILFVGYQADGTLGRQILDGAKDVRIFGQNVAVNAHVREVTSLSSHADYNGLMEWLQKIDGYTDVILTHGEDDARDGLEQHMKEKRITGVVHKPQYGESLEI